MSGSRKRSYGANCDAGIGESRRKRHSLVGYVPRANRRLYRKRGHCGAGLQASRNRQRNILRSIRRLAINILQATRIVDSAWTLIVRRTVNGLDLAPPISIKTCMLRLPI